MGIEIREKPATIEKRTHKIAKFNALLNNDMGKDFPFVRIIAPRFVRRKLDSGFFNNLVAENPSREYNFRITSIIRGKNESRPEGAKRPTAGSGARELYHLNNPGEA